MLRRTYRSDVIRDGFVKRKAALDRLAERAAAPRHQRGLRAVQHSKRAQDGRYMRLDGLLAPDDFGTGYSSLSYLQRFAVDKIKIDRSFVANIGEGSDSTAIVSAVVMLGRSMGLTINAEGVETPAQRDFLGAAGCDELQGFLFSKAVPEAEITKCLQKERSAA